MKRKIQTIVGGLCILLAGTFTTSIHAQTITVPQTGNETAWGPSETEGYGQTLLGSNTELTSFTFSSLSSFTASSFNYNTFIYAFDPTTKMEVGSALYESPTENVPASGIVSSTIHPDLTLSAGVTYIVLVTATSQTQSAPNSSSAAAYMGIGASASYVNGQFYFSNSSFVDGFTTAVWIAPGENTAFIAVFGSPTFSSFALTPNQQAVLAPINAGIVNSNASANFSTLVNDLAPLSGSPTVFGAALDQLSPEEFGRFAGITAFNNASFETEAMDEYLAGRRDSSGNFLGGNGQLDTSGLVINDPSYDPGLAMIHSRMLAWNAGPSDGTISDVARPLLGGVDMKDSKDVKSMVPPAAYSDPWNFFVRGNVVLGQGLSQNDVSHFDDNTESVVGGADYRISPNMLIGLTAGYGHTDATLDDNGSSATVDSYSPGFYASYADKGWYADLTGDYVHNAYTQQRNINFLGQTANSAPEGNEGVANIDGGYDFHHGALTYGPLAGLQYTHLSVDGYNETGSIADLSVDDQEADSLRSRLGGRVSYAFSHFGVNFTPHLDATWQHEFMDQSRGITSQFEGQGLGSFSVRTDAPQRDFALADAGLDAQINHTLTAFADYSVQAGQSNYFGQAVQAGVRIGF